MTSAYSFSVNYSPGRLTAISDAAGKLVESLSDNVQQYRTECILENQG